MPLAHFAEQFPVTVNCLKQAAANQRLAHAYLLHGDLPETREKFAVALSQLILCPEAARSGDACGTCPLCVKVEKGLYPETFVLTPSSKSRRIQIGDIDTENTLRWFDDQFYLKSATETGIKIGVIHDADRMVTEAQNAFLKTLEEPPGHSHFILTTGNPSSLLTTIRSRCQTLPLLANSCQYDFPAAKELFAVLTDLFAHSQKNLAKAEANAERLIALSSQLHDQAEATISEAWEKRLSGIDELSAATRKRVLERHKAAIESEYLKTRSYFLSAIHTWTAQLCQLAVGADPNHLANPEILGSLPKRAKNLDAKAMFRTLGKAEELLDNLNWSVNESLAFRDFCLGVAFGA